MVNYYVRCMYSMYSLTTFPVAVPWALTSRSTCPVTTVSLPSTFNINFTQPLIFSTPVTKGAILLMHFFIQQQPKHVCPSRSLSLRFTEAHQALVSACEFVLKLNMTVLMMNPSDASCIADREIAAPGGPALPSQSGVVAVMVARQHSQWPSGKLLRGCHSFST